jgi:thymidine kinase/Zn-dependent peptidase ImmA (M78 family)
MGKHLPFGQLAHLAPTEAAKYIRSLWNPDKERFAPIEKLAELWPVSFLRVEDPDWQFGPDNWGKVFYDDNDVPTRVIIRRGGRVPVPRSRFTEAHEAGHLAFGDRPMGNGIQKSLNRGTDKELYRKGVSTGLRWQDAVGNERADQFAQAVLVDEERLQGDLRADKRSFKQLCGDYGVSRWVLASSIVRVSPQSCVAIPFSQDGPLGIIHANNAAMKNSGLYHWALRRLWERRQISQWGLAEAALNEQQEKSQTVEINGFRLKILFIPTSADSWFFRYRNDNAVLIGLFMEDLEASTVHRLPSAQFTSTGGKLRLILGPFGAAKSRRLLQELNKQRNLHGVDRVAAYRFFGNLLSSRDEGDPTKIMPLWDRSGVDILEELPDDIKVVAFDEAHFAKKRFAHVVKFLLSKGKEVIIAASDCDFRAEPWPTVQYLLPIAKALNSPIEYPPTPCQWSGGCFETARFSQLVGYYPDDVYHIITEHDTFYPVCEKHFQPRPVRPDDWGSILSVRTKNDNGSHQLSLSI